MFTKEALERFKNPRNAGEIKKFDAFGISGDPGCSDVVQLSLRIRNNKIIEGKFKVFGCPGAISTTDAFIDLIKGKSIDDALKVSEKDVSEFLGGMPVEHSHCSNLAIEAFKQAIDKWR